MIALVDCNNFYVECERLFQPRLSNKPVVVLSNNDGCIVSRSNEVKQLGIPMGIPVFQARDELLFEGVEMFSSNYALYGDMSARIIATLRQFTSAIEVYSIDESFIELPKDKDKDKDRKAHCHHIKETVKKWTGLPVSIGIGMTKSLAKLANKVAKKYTSGVFDLVNHPRHEKVLDYIPVGDVWGIGKRYTEKLNQHGIETVYQLTRADDKWIQKHLTITGLRIVMELRGIPCLPLELTPSPKKSIGRSRSFGRSVTKIEDLKQALAMHVTSAAKVLREEGSVASCMQVVVETNPFVEPYHGKHITAKFETPTASTPAMIKCAHEGLMRIYREGESYTRAGIYLTDLCSENAIQASLFCEPNTERSRDVMEVVDKLMVRFGRHKIKWASEGLKQKWAMRQAHLSQRYTTKWDEILKVGV
jgi:DNA polymerase V